VSFALSGAVKDGRLIRSALRSADVPDRLMAAVTETLEEAVRRVPDPAALDMSAVIEALSPKGHRADREARRRAGTTTAPVVLYSWAMHTTGSIIIS